MLANGDESPQFSRYAVPETQWRHRVARKSQRIVDQILAFRPDDGNWLPLDDLLAQLWESGVSDRQIPSLFSLLERYPDEDGAGVLWSIVHGVESLPGYETQLVLSVRRRPSLLGIAMIQRLLNSGTNTVDGESLTELLQTVERSPDCTEEIRRTIASCLLKSR